jgi:hypothetical protein
MYVVNRTNRLIQRPEDVIENAAANYKASQETTRVPAACHQNHAKLTSESGIVSKVGGRLVG